MIIKLRQILAFLIALVSIVSVNQWSRLPVKNTIFWWGIYIIIYIIIFYLKKDVDSLKHIHKKQFNYLSFYLILVIINILRALFIADNYWEYKYIFQFGLALFLPMIVYVAVNRTIVQNIITTWLYIGFPLFFLILPFLLGEAVGRYLVPFSFLALFLPVLKFKWKIFITVVIIAVVLFDFSARSNIMRFTIPFLLCFLYYFRRLLGVRFFNILGLLLYLFPFIFLILAITGTYNFFEELDNINSDNIEVTSENFNGVKEVSITNDTRTFLYYEVLNSAIKNNYIIFGRSPARGNDSATFGANIAKGLNTTKKERIANEVSILNIFTWMGVVGVILYSMLFIKASYVAFNHSNNIFSKILGLYVAFRWILAWVEEFTRFDLNMIFLWIIVAMCYSSGFRNLSNDDFKKWVNSLFSVKNVKI